MNILMVAAENDALPKGKVGGIGDVVRDIPVALAELGHQVHVLTPGYQFFSELPGSEATGSLRVDFAGAEEQVDIYRVPAKSPVAGVTHWALEHPLFAAGGKGAIYCDDPGDRPFATDAGKFALFATATAQGVIEGVFSEINVLHLHDWHAALVVVLRQFAPKYQALRAISTVYTIHNLSLQGVRPFSGDGSAFESWFPGLDYAPGDICDPRVPHCLNPMRAGINLSDMVHTVSPTYAAEIVRASDKATAFCGGEGLEEDLQRAHRSGRLVGILNGAEYPDDLPGRLPEDELIALCERELLKWIGENRAVDSARLIAQQRLAQWSQAAGETTMLLTSVGRITDQKVLLLRQQLPDGRSALEAALDDLEGQGRLLMLGSGDLDYETFLTRVASLKQNFIFLKGYSEPLAQNMYSSGDLFLMPSSFEPCGISQMLAMRAAQPCLVHRVGGLNDTVQDNHNGFTFSGQGLQAQAENMLVRLQQVLALKSENPTEWRQIRDTASDARFLWRDSAEAYVKLLY